MWVKTFSFDINIHIPTLMLKLVRLRLNDFIIHNNIKKLARNEAAGSIQIGEIGKFQQHTEIRVCYQEHVLILHQGYQRA